MLNKKYFFLILIIFSQFSFSKEINFSGYQWIVRDSGLGGPGPNVWKEDNVFLDSNGYLHLKLSPLERGCSSAEIQSKEKFSSGQYIFNVSIPEMDKKWSENIVFGMFSYPTKEVGVDKTHEIDIEISKWGNALQKNILNYTVWPTSLKERQFTRSFYYPEEHSHVFKYNRFSFKNEPQIAFESSSSSSEVNLTVDSNSIGSISTEKMPVFVNVWCFKGQSKNVKPLEIILKSFKFIDNER